MTTKRSAAAATIFSRRWAAAAALDQPAVGRHLVGAVDRDVEPPQAVEVLDRDPQLARLFLGRDRGGDAADAADAAAGDRRQQVGDGRAGAEPDGHPVLDQLRRRLRRDPLLRIRPSHGRDFILAAPQANCIKFPAYRPGNLMHFGLDLCSPDGCADLGFEWWGGAAVGGARRRGDGRRALAGGRDAARGRGGLLEPPGDRAARRGADGDRPRQQQRHRPQRRAARPAAAAAQRRHPDRRRPPARSRDWAGDPGRGDGAERRALGGADARRSGRPRRR